MSDDGFWEDPKNVGFPINTENDELAMFVTTDGKTAYFCSNKLNGSGGWDMYSFSLHEDARPGRILFLKGHVLDDDGVLVDSVEIEFKNISR